MGTKTAKIPVECPACGKTFGSAIRGANAKCTGTKDKPCGRTIYIRRDGSYGDKPAPDATDPPAGTATADNGDHDDDTGPTQDPPAPPAPTTTEVPRYGYSDTTTPAGDGGGRPRRKATRRSADVQSADRPRGDPDRADGADGGGTDDGAGDSQPARRRVLDRFRRRRADGPIPYPYGDIFG